MHAENLARQEQNWGSMDQQFQIEERAAHGASIVSVTGEIDVATAPQLQECLHELIASGHTSLVVDLLAVTFLDSTALGVLVGALKRCRERGGELQLVMADPRILKIFEITGLSTVFPIVDSLASVGAP